MKSLILGSGTWGTALAGVLVQGGHDVVLWCRRAERARELSAGHHSFLPGVTLPPGLRGATSEELRGAESNFDLGIAAVPTQHLRPVLEAESAWIPRDIPWISASKGLELGTFRLPSAILEESGMADVGVISGPSHAEEVIRGVPSAVVLGYAEPDRGRVLQSHLSGESFRVYLNSDVCGVEWGGALKNVIALAAGIAVGCGFGDNTLAALVTRGAVEIARLGVSFGGRRETFNGLSGIGDLIVTCFSEHSRNRGFGVRVGQGEKPEAILGSMEQAVEGVHTSRAVVEMCRERGVEMPIAEEVHAILHEGKDIRSGVRALLSRSLKEE